MTPLIDGAIIAVVGQYLRGVGAAPGNGRETGKDCERYGFEI